MLPLHGPQVPSLIGEVRLHMPHNKCSQNKQKNVKKKKKGKKKNPAFYFGMTSRSIENCQDSTERIYVYECMYLTCESEVLVIQSSPNICDPMDGSPSGSSVRGILHKNTGMGCHFLLQGIFPTQGLNPSLPHCRQTLYQLSHQGSLYLT